MEIWNIQHPWYKKYLDDWLKYRLTYEGGQRFIQEYLKTFSKREEEEEFKIRKSITYCPAFAASAINDIKNSIYQRMSEISRIDGSKDYQAAIVGLDGGVDLEGATMNNFIGQTVLPELLVMGKVGVFVDMPQLTGTTMAETLGEHPYLYIYTAEQIPSWSCVTYQGERIITTLMLHETVMLKDSVSNLTYGSEEQIRVLKLLDEGVQVTFYGRYHPETAEINPPKYKEIETTLIRGMKRIPFHIAELNHSLLKNVADYQIALLNMESADVSYILRGNFPFYVEPYDPRSTSPFITPAPSGETIDAAEGVNSTSEVARQNEVRVGAVSGRRYPFGVGAPSFINPSSEPLKASMDKEAQMKSDIRHLVNLALTAVEPKFASAESKSMDDRSLEAGLSYIGLELERLERDVGKSWSFYVRNESYPTIKYPRKYSLKSDKERREEAKEFVDLTAKIPSRTCQKEVAKTVTSILLEQKVNKETLDKIYSEIDKADYLTSDFQAVKSDVELGLVSMVTASTARGYDGEKEIPIAKQEHTERLAEIAAAQAPAGGSGDSSSNGVKDQQTNPDKSKQEKVGKPQRGPDVNKRVT